MRALVTGSGPLGCRTARVMSQQGTPVVLVDRAPSENAVHKTLGGLDVRLRIADILDAQRLADLMVEQGTTCVIHTAALLTGAMRGDPRAGLRVNIEGTASVLEAARRSGVKRVIVASSTTVAYQSLGRLTQAPVAEDVDLRLVSERPFSFYAASKLASEHVALLYGEQFDLDVIVLRYAAVLGLWHGPDNSIPARFLRALLSPALRGQPSVIDDRSLAWAGGEEFIDLRDAAAATMAAARADGVRERVYNVGSGRLATMDDLVAAARLVAPRLRLDLRVEPKGGFAGSAIIRQQPSDISALRHDLGFVPAHDLASTLRAATDFLRENP